MKTKITYKKLKETIAKANELISGITFNELAGTLLKDHNLESMILAQRSCHGGFSGHLTLRVFADGHLKFAYEAEKNYANDYNFGDSTLITFASLVNDTTDTVNLLVNEYLNDYTVKHVISWTLNKIYVRSDARPYFKGITFFDELISTLKRTKLISLTKIKNTDSYKLKIKPTNTEYVLKYFINRKDYDEFYFNQVFGGDSRAETIEKLLVEKYQEAKLIRDTILNDIDTVYAIMADKVNDGIRELAVRDSFINYVNNIDNPVSRYMEFKDGSWSMLDKDLINGWVNYGETVKPTYVEYNHRTNEILGIHNIVPTDLPTLIKTYLLQK